MTESVEPLSESQVRQLAADPQTPAQQLAVIAYAHPEARPLIAGNPATYDGLLEWLRALGDPDVDMALAARRSGGSVPPTVLETEPVWKSQSGFDLASESRIPDSDPSFRMRPGLRLTARYKTYSKAIAVVVVGVLVIGGALAFAANSFGNQQVGGDHRTSSSDFTTLTAHGEPLTGDAAPSLKLAWNISAAALGYVSSHLSIVVQTPTVWVLSVVLDGADDQQAGALVAISATTGQELWHNDTVGGSCAGAASGSVVCLSGTGPYGIGQASTLTLVQVAVADGKVTRETTLEQLGFTGSNLYSSLESASSSVLLTVADEGANGYTQPSTVTLARVNDNTSSLMWKTTQAECGGGGDNWPSVTRVVNGVLLISNASSHEVLDFATGATLAQVGCQAVDLFGDGGLLIAGDGTGTSIIDSSRIHSLITGSGGNVNASPVDFESSESASSVPVVFTSAADGTLSIIARTTVGSDSTWAQPLVLQGSKDDPMVYGAVDSRRLILVDTAGHVVSVNPKTGRVLWSASYSALHIDSSGAAYVPVSVSFGPGETVLVSDLIPGTQFTGRTASFATYAYNARTGEELTSPSGWSAYQSGTARGGTSRQAVVPGTLPVTGNASVGALVANSISAEAVAHPSLLPDCPAGYKPISWTVVPSGYVLLCSGKNGYRAMVRLTGHPVVCSSVMFLAAGYTLGCEANSTVAITGDGTILQRGAGSKSSIVTASTGWMVGDRAAGGFGASTAKISDGCPSGSVLLSLSQWKSGWLFVCGTDALDPSYLAFSDGAATEASRAVTYDLGRYCATRTIGGSVCAVGAPAVVSITAENGTTTQRPVDHNFFVSQGSSGFGQGTGAYNVTAPKDAANDEVRYLEQILQKSIAGRTQAGDLLHDIGSCTINSADIQKAASLVANRQQLLSALSSTPVDRIPNGSRLVTELTIALTASLQADQTYQTAISDLNSSGCAQATNDMSGATSQGNSIETLKGTFVSDWNSTVVGSYPSTSPFTSKQI